MRRLKSDTNLHATCSTSSSGPPPSTGSHSNSSSSSGHGNRSSSGAGNDSSSVAAVAAATAAAGQQQWQQRCMVGACFFYPLPLAFIHLSLLAVQCDSTSTHDGLKSFIPVFQSIGWLLQGLRWTTCWFPSVEDAITMAGMCMDMCSQ